MVGKYLHSTRGIPVDVHGREGQDNVCAKCYYTIIHHNENN